jgi:MFS transporter, NNP family, nitrate/nitrite transporter
VALISVPRDRRRPRSWSPRAVVAVIVTTAGLGLNLRAWILLGPHLHDRFAVEPADHMVLVGLPLLVAAVVRLPVGVLTDSYGARVMFPLVSLAAAASVVGLGLAGSVPAVVLAGCGAGVAGAAFVVGATLLSRTLPYGRRGLALGIFSLGPVLGVIASAVSRGFDPDGRRAAFALGGLLVAFAGVAAVVLRDNVPVHRVRSPLRRCVEVLRLVSTTSLSLLYALALGGLVAIAVFLPMYLATALGLGWVPAVAITGAVVGLGALARLVGGWWTDRYPTVALLKVCYTVAAGLCVLVALAPRLWWLTVSVVAAIAVCDGLASGALLALIGKVTPPDSAGAVMGATGAAAALGALALPLLLTGVDQLSDSHSAAWIVLAGVLLSVVWYVRTQGLRIGLGLAVPFEAEPTETAMTVTVVGGADTRLDAAAVVTRLAELATNDELVVVYGADDVDTLEESPGRRTNVLVAGLRYRLPRHSVVAVDIRRQAWCRPLLGTTLTEFVEAGTVAIAVIPMSDLRGTAAELSSYLGADRVMTMSYSLTQGARLHEVWRRPCPPGERRARMPSCG